MVKKYDLLKRIYTILIVFTPLLGRYNSVVPYVTPIEVLFFLWIILELCNKGKASVVKSLMPVLIVIIIRTSFSLFDGSTNLLDSVGTGLRLIFLYFIICFYTKRYFDFDYGFKIIKIIATIISIYGLLQLFFSNFDIYLTSYIPGFTPRNDVSTDSHILLNVSRNIQYRMTSLLNEPSHLALYLILPLFLILFKSKQSKKELLLCVLYSITNVLCLSSTGIIVTTIIWSLHFTKYRKVNIKTIILGIIVILLSYVILFSMGVYEYFINRTFGGSITSFSFEGTTRFNSLNETFAFSESLFGIFFGGGFGHSTAYLPGIARVYYHMGILGLVSLGWSLYSIFKIKKNKSDLFIYIILNIGTEMLLGDFFVYYMPFILFNYKENKENYRKFL